MNDKSNSMTAGEFLTKWSKGKTFSEETRDQSYIEFAESYHRERMKDVEEYAAESYKLGLRDEKRSILGIIEKMKSPVVMDWVNKEQDAQVRGWEMAMKKLTQKIKGESKPRKLIS